MDPLTHTLVGANLAATRLGRKTPMATAALLVGANLPDVDILAYAAGSDLAYGLRRGCSHSLLALAVLPFLLTAVLLLWQRRRRRGPPILPAQPLRLLLLSALAVATHPALDWLNTYGMRWLMPFDGTWFYGDAVFIMDPWLWLLLGGAWLSGRRPTAGLLVFWACAAGGIITIAFVRAPRYLPVAAITAAVLLVALLRWPPVDRRTIRRLAASGLTLACAYIAAMIGTQALTEARVRRELERSTPPIEGLMVGPVPCDPTSWDVLAVLPDAYRWGRFRWLPNATLELRSESLPRPRSSPVWREVRRRPEVSGFLTWARFPWLEVETGPGATRVFLMDARYVRSRTTGFAGAVLELGPGAVPAPTAGGGAIGSPRP